jgi:hypothetical protein
MVLLPKTAEAEDQRLPVDRPYPLDREAHCQSLSEQTCV